MAVRLKLVVIPRRRRLDDVGKSPHQILGRILLESVLRRAVLNVTAAGVQICRVGLGNADDISAQIVRNRLDVARHRRRVVYSHSLRIDFAVR